MGANRLSSANSSDFETTRGGTWRIAIHRNYLSRFEPPWQVSPAANHLDVIVAVEAALAEKPSPPRLPAGDTCTIDPDRGEPMPVITLVTDTDTGGSFRAFRFEAFAAQHPYLRHVSTGVKSLGPKTSCERGFESLKCERLYLEMITDGPHPARHEEAYRVEYNSVRLHVVLGWNCPLGVHIGRRPGDN